MLTIPGRYIGTDGGDYTLLMLAADGESGEKTALYRREADGLFFTLAADAWESRFTPVEELEAEQTISAAASETAGRMLRLFAGRTEVCSSHRRTAFGSELHNYLCENRELVPGCMYGTDSCKNCREGRLAPFSADALLRHLNGEITLGVYPVAADGRCRFLCIEADSESALGSMLELCRGAEIPAYGEVFGKRHRIWIFFAVPVPAEEARALGNSIITHCTEGSAEALFSLYDSLSPYSPDRPDYGRPIILPLGRLKNKTSYFIDSDGKPLSKNAIFGFRTVTKSYLADRLRFLGKTGLGRLYGSAAFSPEAPALPDKLPLRLDAGVALPKNGLEPKALNALRRLACFRNPDFAAGEFEAPTPAVLECFYEDEKSLTLPRGVFSELSTLLALSGTEPIKTEKRLSGERSFLSAELSLSEEQTEAVSALLARSEGIILGRTGSGKTGVAAAIIGELKTTTLIITADEASRRRWIDNIYRIFGADAQRAGSKIRVCLASDEKTKDKYALVILADCSRLPMSREIYSRISALSPSRIYGITADTSRRDGLWGYIHMLCGDVVCNIAGKRK